MNKKQIEVELRAEIPIRKVEDFKIQLNKMGKVLSNTKRLSVMFFGKINEQDVDIRVRTTNGDCEVVVKFGSFGSYNRTELCQKIETSQFLGMTRIFSQFKFIAKVGERETINYELPDNIVASIVLAGNIAYIEIEKMSSDLDFLESEVKLRKILDNLALQVLDEEKLNDLCERLNKSVDWSFSGSHNDYLKLENNLKKLTTL